jgi:hypothetical protein
MSPAIHWQSASVFAFAEGQKGKKPWPLRG